jgi:glycosyltransferase involved in cell wall biosynthesis
MHVCFISREYPPNTMGGIGTYVVNMADVLLDAGHKVTVVTKWHPQVGRHAGFAGPEIRRNGRLNIIYLPFADEDWKLDPRCSGPEVDALARRDIATAFGYTLAHGLLRLVDNSDIDIIEAPEYEYPAYYYQLLRHAQDASSDARSRRVPVVVHLHSPSLSIFRENEEYIATPWQRFRCLHEKASVRYADAVLSPSAFLADEVTEWAGIPRDTIHLIPYPLGKPLVAPEASPVAQNRFLFVGRIEPRKGIFEYVEAAVRHAHKHPTAEFRFIGGPHVRTEVGDGRTTQAVVEEFIPKSVRSQFRFMSKVSRDRLAAEYASAGFCVVPSRWDNYPNTCMEPMSLGRPVLVSDRGGQAELVEDGVSGIVARGGNTPRDLVEALTSALERAHAMDESTRATMGQAARDRVARVCDNDAVLSTHLHFYTSVCEAASRRRESAKPVQLLACIFAPKGANKALSRTLESLPSPPVTRSLVAATRPLPGIESEQVRVLQLTAEDRLPRSGIRKGWWTRTIEQEAAAPESTFVLFAGPGTRIADGFLSAALRVMQAQPRIAFCTGWVGRGRNRLRWTGGEVDQDSLLADWEPFPACGLLRWSAVSAAGGLEGRGILFRDSIRDLQARLADGGHACLSLPICGLDNMVALQYANLDMCGFHEAADSNKVLRERWAGVYVLGAASGRSETLYRGVWLRRVAVVFRLLTGKA